MKGIFKTRSKGFALRTSLASLERALQTTKRNWRISQMLYWDKSQEITPDDTHNDLVLKQCLRYPYLLKSREYQYENEVRLCTVDAGARPNLLVEGVHPEEWIKEIRISPELWFEDASIIHDLICQHYPAMKDRLGQSPLSNAPSEFDGLWSEHVAKTSIEGAAKNWPPFRKRHAKSHYVNGSYSS